MTVKWQRENAEGTLWSATVLDGQQGWLRDPSGRRHGDTRRRRLLSLSRL
jgi:hypothetical protein